MTLDIKAVLTDEAARRSSETVLGKSFRVVGFALGSAGADPSDPAVALTPNPAQTEMQGVVFGPKSLSQVFFDNETCPVFQGVVAPGEGVTLFNQVYLIAEIVVSPVPDDPELGTTFLYAIYNGPTQPHLDGQNLIINCGIQR